MLASGNITDCKVAPECVTLLSGIKELLGSFHKSRKKNGTTLAAWPGVITNGPEIVSPHSTSSL